MKWTPEEEFILEQLWKDAPRELIYRLLPKRRGNSWSSFKSKANRMGLEGREAGLKMSGHINDEELLQEVNRRGYYTVKKRLKQDERFEYPEITGKLRFGAVSDSHFGNKWQQITHLHDIYDWFKKKGIDTVFHAGDITEGDGNVYKGQEYEMFLHGTDNQTKYVVENYPRVEGIETHFIGGNHDYSFFKSSGHDILQNVDREREDMKYLGMMGAYVDFGDLSIYLMHGSGGVAYARSYKMQKFIEQFAPENKPNVLILGHYHVDCYLPKYRNVEGIQMPCFEAQTPYLKRSNRDPQIGGVIVEIVKDEKGIYSVKPEFKYYYVPIKDDF